MNIASIENVCFAYHFGNNVLDDLNLAVPEGSVTGLLGHNGAGKTTIMRVLAGLFRPDAGSVRFRDGNRPSVSYMPEGSGIYDKLSVAENLEFRGYAQNMSRKDILSGSENLIERLGLAEKRKTKAGYLSGGQKKRLSLACALINGPDLLLLDEPTNGVDPFSLKVIVDLLKETNSAGTAVLVSSHNLDFVGKVCSNITVIQNGKEIYSGEVPGREELERMYIRQTEGVEL